MAFTPIRDRMNGAAPSGAKKKVPGAAERPFSKKPSGVSPGQKVGAGPAQGGTPQVQMPGGMPGATHGMPGQAQRVGAMTGQNFEHAAMDKGTPAEPQEEQSSIDKIYEDLMAKHDESWGTTEEMQRANAANLERRAASWQGAMGRSVAGGFAGAIGQAMLTGEQNLLQAKQAHEQAGMDLQMAWADRQREEERYQQGREDDQTSMMMGALASGDLSPEVIDAISKGGDLDFGELGTMQDAFADAEKAREDADEQIETLEEVISRSKRTGVPDQVVAKYEQMLAEAEAERNRLGN